MSDVVTAVEYRLTRPDGTVLWTCVTPNYLGVPKPPVAPQVASYPDSYALPPWRYEGREPGGEWTLLASDPQVGGQ